MSTIKQHISPEVPHFDRDLVARDGLGLLRRQQVALFITDGKIIKQFIEPITNSHEAAHFALIRNGEVDPEEMIYSGQAWEYFSLRDSVVHDINKLARRQSKDKPENLAA